MSKTVDLIHNHGLIVVVAAPVQERLFEWAIAVANGGIKLLGIPITFPRVTELTSDLADEANLCVGVTGVVYPDQVMSAVAAGADFIVSPVANPEVVRAGKERGLTVVAAGATPTEIANVATAQPDLVAVYPAGGLGGPAQFKRLRRLLPDIRLVAAGGVDVETAPGYLEAGAVAAIVDTGVFPSHEDPAAMQVIATRAAALTEVCNEVLGRSDRVSVTDILAPGVL